MSRETHEGAHIYPIEGSSSLSIILSRCVWSSIVKYKINICDSQIRTTNRSPCLQVGKEHCQPREEMTKEMKNQHQLRKIKDVTDELVMRLIHHFVSVERPRSTSKRDSNERGVACPSPFMGDNTHVIYILL